MRRIATAAVAATTAMSLVAAPAMAKTSSEITDDEAGLYFAGSLLAEALAEGSGFTPSMRAIFADAMKKDQNSEDVDLSILKSSVYNDAANGYKVGTTFDILLGTGIAALVLALAGGYALSQGLVKLPF